MAFIWKCYLPKNKYDIPKINKDFDEKKEFLIDVSDNGRFHNMLSHNHIVNLYSNGYKAFKGKIISITKNCRNHDKYIKKTPGIMPNKKDRVVVTVKVTFKYQISKAIAPGQAFQNFEIDF